MAIHLIADDPTPDEPTVPEPTVCPTCEGERIIDAPLHMSEFWLPCPDCCCTTCGEPTSTPPLCERHQREQDDDTAAKAWREGRYE